MIFNTKPIPENIRTNVEKELYKYCMHRHIITGLAATMAVHGARQIGQRALPMIHDNVERLRACLDEIENLWPDGKWATKDLKEICHAFVNWQSDFKEWIEFTYDIDEGRVEMDEARIHRYGARDKDFVEKEKEQFARAVQTLSGRGIALDAINEESEKKVVQKLNENKAKE